MRDLFQELLTSTAADGASVQLDVPPGRREADLDELMDAWLEERHANIESRFFLERARRLLVRITAEGELRPETRRRARRLIQAIEATRRDECLD